MVYVSHQTPHMQIKYLVRRSYNNKNFNSYTHNKSPSWISAYDNNMKVNKIRRENTHNNLYWFICHNIYYTQFFTNKRNSTRNSITV